MYGYFSKGTDPPLRPYSTRKPSPPDPLRRPPFPTHSGRRMCGHEAFATLEVLFGRPTTRRAPLPTSLTLIGSLLPVPPGSSTSPPGVTSWSSVPCRPQTPWYGGWMRDAFASIVQARPCPTFGRPVRHGVAPIDYGPVLLLMPFGSRLAAGTLPSELREVAPGPPWLYPAFAFVPV
jgi:hypothetical protein